MFPLKDNLRYSVFPWATVTIVALNILFFTMEMSLSSIGELQGHLQNWLLSRDALFAACAHGNMSALLHCFAALFMPLFLHEGFEHIFGNMCFFFAFAPAVEARLGWKRFTAFYLASGLVAGFFQIFSDPTGYGVGLGASGCIAGVMGAYLVLFPKARAEGWVSLSPIPLPVAFSAFIFILDFMLQQGLSAWVAAHNVQFAKQATVGFWDHLGGMTTGILVGTAIRIHDWLKPPTNPVVMVPEHAPKGERTLYELIIDIPDAILRTVFASIGAAVMFVARPIIAAGRTAWRHIDAHWHLSALVARRLPFRRHAH